MTKTFSKDTLLSIDGFIYLVDEAGTATEGCRAILGKATVTGLIDKQYFNEIKTQKKQADFRKIIASQNPSLEGVAKIDLDTDLKEFEDTLYPANVDRNNLTDTAKAVGKKLMEMYKAASSKKKYTEDDMRGLLKYIGNQDFFVEDDGSVWKNAFMNGTRVDAVADYLQSLKPSPISIEIEWEEIMVEPKGYLEPYPYLDNIPKLKDGCVIIKEVKWSE